MGAAGRGRRHDRQGEIVGAATVIGVQRALLLRAGVRPLGLNSRTAGASARGRSRAPGPSTYRMLRAEPEPGGQVQRLPADRAGLVRFRPGRRGGGEQGQVERPAADEAAVHVQ